MAIIKCDNLLLNTLLDNFSADSLDENCCCAYETELQLCESLIASFLKLSSDYGKTENQDWNRVTTLAMRLTSLQRVLLVLTDNAYKNMKKSMPCVALVTSADILKSLCFLLNSAEKLICYEAQRTLSLIVVLLCKDENFIDQWNHVSSCIFHKLFYSFINKQQLCSCLDVITAIMNQFEKLKIEVPEKLCGEIITFYKNNLAQFYSDALFFSYLKFHSKIIDVFPKSKHIIGLMLEQYSSLLKMFNCCISDPTYRLLYLKVLKNLLHYPPPQEHFANTINAAVNYLEVLQYHSSVLQRLFQLEPQFVGFGGRVLETTVLDTEKVNGFSKSEKMQILNGILNALCHILKDEGSAEFFFKSQELFKLLLIASRNSDEAIAEELIEIYFEQDDAMINMLLHHLLLNTTLKRSSELFLTSPHLLFIKLLESLAYDSSILLDWLTSNETQFLLYFLKYLKYLATTFEAFLTDSKRVVCSSSSPNLAFANSMCTLTNLKQSIEKLCSRNLFPYQVGPLLKVLDKVILFGRTSGY